MLKRYLPLLFVLLVVVATALFYLLFRGAPDSAPAPPATTRTATVPRTGDDGIPEFRIESEEEYQLALDALGTSNDEIEAWARSRGFPPATYTSSPGMPLERNYRTERDARLLELAEEGDVWAMQILAARIAPEMPLEAIDWYRKAVIQGSAFAAFKLGGLYQEIARWAMINQDDREEVLEIVQREDPLAYSSLAWLLIAEYEAGLPPGAMSATLAGFQSPDDAILNSCSRAATILAEIHAQREALGITVIGHKPPLAIELPPEETAGYCPPDVFPRADFSGCETIRLVGDAGAVIGHRCR
jgi:hypothetical protein